MDDFVSLLPFYEKGTFVLVFVSRSLQSITPDTRDDFFPTVSIPGAADGQHGEPREQGDLSLRVGDTGVSASGVFLRATSPTPDPRCPANTACVLW